MSETEVNAVPEQAPMDDVEHVHAEPDSVTEVAAELGEQRVETAAETAPKPQTVGMRLAAEREAKQWSVGYVANQLNLAPRQIQALETDNFAALPGMVSVRGFIRSYAKLLKIDAGLLVAMIPGDPVVQPVQLEPRRSLSPMPFADNLLMSTGGRRVPKVLLLVALLVVVLAIAAIEWRDGLPALSQSMPSSMQLAAPIKEGDAASADAQGEQLPTATNADNAANAAASSEAAVATPSMAVSTLKDIETNQPEKQAESANAAKGQSDPAVKTEAAAVHAAPAPVAQKPAAVVQKPLAGAAKSLLVFTVRQDSWIQVKGSGDALLARLVKGGSTETVEVSEPVDLVLGNAAGVDVTFRGSPVDISADVKSNVARLTLK